MLQFSFQLSLVLVIINNNLGVVRFWYRSLFGNTPAAQEISRKLGEKVLLKTTHKRPTKPNKILKKIGRYVGIDKPFQHHDEIPPGRMSVLFCPVSVPGLNPYDCAGPAIFRGIQGIQENLLDFHNMPHLNWTMFIFPHILLASRISRQAVAYGRQPSDGKLSPFQYLVGVWFVFGSHIGQYFPDCAGRASHCRVRNARSLGCRRTKWCIGAGSLWYSQYSKEKPALCVPCRKSCASRVGLGES